MKLSIERGTLLKAVGSSAAQAKGHLFMHCIINRVAFIVKLLNSEKRWALRRPEARETFLAADRLSDALLEPLPERKPGLAPGGLFEPDWG